MKTLQAIRASLYSINALQVSMHMIGMQERDDDIVTSLSESLSRVLRWLDEIIAASEATRQPVPEVLMEPGLTELQKRISRVVMEQYGALSREAELLTSLYRRSRRLNEIVAQSDESLPRMNAKLNGSACPVVAALLTQDIDDLKATLMKGAI